MKEKIIEIIGFQMEPECAEMKASQIIILFNQRVVDALKEVKNGDLTEIINKIFISL